MKKFLALLLAALMVVAVVAGCGKTTPTEEDTTPAQTEGDTTAKEDTEEALKTVTEGKLTMATNAEFPPYEFYEGDKVVGIDAEVADLIAKKLGLELEIVDVEFDSIIPGVQAGKYDMGMAGMTVNEDRLKNINFTESYATGVQVVIVKEDSEIKTLDDVAGKKVGVQQGTTGDIYASDDFGEENVTKYANGALAVEGLKTGKVDCVIIDNEPAKNYVAANEGLKILETEYAVEDYAICVAKENDALMTAINDALKELIADGSVATVVGKYIKAE